MEVCCHTHLGWCLPAVAVAASVGGGGGGTTPPVSSRDAARPDQLMKITWSHHTSPPHHISSKTSPP